MIIVSKNGDTLINMERTAYIYASIENGTVRAATTDTRNPTIKLGEYESVKLAKKAVQMLCRDMELKQICYMPDDDAVKAALIAERHGIDGKKGHGGG